MDYSNVQIAELLVRVFAGILFMLQGYDKLFHVKMSGVINTFVQDADRYNIPRPLLNLVAYYTSIVEFIGGILLILGIFTSYTLYALGLDLILVGFAFTYMSPMWDMKFVFPRLAMVVTLLLMPEEYNYFSLDQLLTKK
ncbi:DoxX family membrane protein [Aurantibacillus circumpalustris]|uniref:DoxX family membrane protein n=1 Tax=Aurantibacillus circumpalustris TaxID=3036359 RepID=UPI00295B56B0|nr:DoxX family membrane protein [Aurantibacillus circumpalustris]